MKNRVNHIQIGIIFNVYQTLKVNESEEIAKSFLGVFQTIIKEISLNIEDLEKIMDYNNYFYKRNYYDVKNTLHEVLQMKYGISNYYSVINYFRGVHGFNYDNNYLKLLLKPLEKKIRKINNDRLNGLFNLLNDSNLTYNNIGVRILTVKYLTEIKDLTELNLFRVDNTRLNDEYKYLSVKLGEHKFYSKLFFYKEEKTIVLKTMEHDRIINIGITTENNINFLYGGENLDKDFKHIENLKEYSKKYRNVEESNFNKLRYLFVKSYNMESEEYSDDFITYNETEELEVNYMLRYLNKKGSRNRLLVLELLDTLEYLNRFYLNFNVEDNTLQDKEKRTTLFEEYQYEDILY